MTNIAQEIRIAVERNAGRLAAMRPAEVSAKAAPDRWSKKEILGHLIDSAANNHQRFVRAGYNTAADFPTYQQNDWVRLQHYNDADWEGLVALWTAYNRHLGHVLESLPRDAFSAPCNIGKEEPVTLEFVAEDYLKHMLHHLEELLRGIA